MNIYEIDKNFAPVSTDGDGTVFYDVRKPPFRVYGLYSYKTESVFKRLPDEVAASVSEGVKNLYFDTAGGRVRFSTDSSYITLSVECFRSRNMAHMPQTGMTGFDLYVDGEGELSRYKGTFIPPVTARESYVAKVVLGEKKQRFITINFPLYGGVKRLLVGIKDGASLGEGLPYANEAPVIYYGSSITQGGCASRPGSCYQNIVARRLSLDYINLGFSGNGRAEDAIVEYMASLDIRAFVSDYDHNSPNPEHLEITNRNMYRKIREKHPDIPYIMMSKPDFDKNPDDARARRAAILKAYGEGTSEGDKNLYFIDGERIFREPYRDECTVDGTHPNDLGFAFMADAVCEVLSRALDEKRTNQ